jgi:hypothetical protein
MPWSVMPAYPAFPFVNMFAADKCSKPLDDSMVVISDPDLPSVL